MLILGQPVEGLAAGMVIVRAVSVCTPFKLSGEIVIRQM